MNDHIIVYAVIDYEKDIACAALTQTEAEEIMNDSEGGDFHLDNVYLYGNGILTGDLLTELKTLLETRETLGVDSAVTYPCVSKLVAYLAEQPLARDQKDGDKNEW
jgi:hypothetical protein